MKKKLVLIGCAVLALALLAVGMMLLYRTLRPVPTVDASEEKSFTVMVVHKDGTIKEFSYTTTEILLGGVLQAEGLIDGEEGAYGLMISTVDGEVADWTVDNGYWWLLVNGQDAVEGISKTPIQDGDQFTLEYRVG